MVETIRVDYLARVEGEGAFTIVLEGDRVKRADLRIFEPPRLFEGFLTGRGYAEVPDITARICGICPVAYQMSACHALEAAFGVHIGDTLRRLRRLLYCGEWIESHALHMFCLHLPDFLGKEDVLEIAEEHGEVVKAALRIKKVGNAIVRVLGGREIHPINVKVGGFYRLPAPRALAELLPELEWARERMLEIVPFLAGLPFPEIEQDYELVALRHPEEYPFCEGRLVSSRGLDIAVGEYEACFEERHLERSTALHSVRRGGGHYLSGPLARFDLCFDRLRPAARAAADAARLAPPVRNPFKSLLVRAVETVQALDEAIEIIEQYRPPPAASVPVRVPDRETEGAGCTEAPRGILYHRYRVGRDGQILEAKIVPPTAQNQGQIEDDLIALAPQLAALDQDAATRLAEQAIRNYDPCISCSTHFLKLRIERS